MGSRVNGTFRWDSKQGKKLGGARAEAKREEEARENCHLRDRRRWWKLLNWVFMYLVGSFFFIFPPYPSNSEKEVPEMKDEKKNKNISALTLFSVWKIFAEKKGRKSFHSGPIDRGGGEVKRERNEKNDEGKKNKWSFLLCGADRRAREMAMLF